MEEHAPTQQSVLIIDDDQELLNALVMSLERMLPMRILAAQDTLMALAMVQREHPSCMVVDIMFGKKQKMDGFKFVQIIRGDPNTADIPILFLTSRSADIQRFVGLSVGADNYLVKPVPIKILTAAIEKAIATSPAERTQRLQWLAESEPPQSQD